MKIINQPKLYTLELKKYEQRSGKTGFPALLASRTVCSRRYKHLPPDIICGLMECVSAPARSG